MNKAIIPLYINTSILNNLFTIVIQEFVEIKSVSTKDSVAVRMKTPLSELSYDLFGKYMQGEIDIAFQNEYAKQRTEENISATISILKKLKDILLQHGLLKRVIPSFNLELLSVSDYIEFPCMLKRNPVIENLTDTINMLELGGTINSRRDELSTDSMLDNFNTSYLLNRGEMLNYLRNALNYHKQQRVIRYLAQSIGVPSINAIIPLKLESLLDYEDYLLNGDVEVFGKIVKINQGNNSSTHREHKRGEEIHSPLHNDAFFDYIDYDKIFSSQGPFLKANPTLRPCVLENGETAPYEILPIAIYI